MRRVTSRPARRLARLWAAIAEVVRRWRRSPSVARRRAFWIASVAVPLFLAYNVYLFVRISLRMDRFIWDVPSRVFAAPVALYPGLDASRIGLWEHLHALGYWRVSREPERPGEYYRGRTLDIYLREREFAEGREAPLNVRIGLSGTVLREIRPARGPGEYGDPLPLVRLDPLPIARIYADVREEREIVPLRDLPPHLVSAIIAVEDRRFFGHLGLSPRGIARALWANLRAGRTTQGGSTISQQLVKNLFLTHKRTLSRKVNEALMAVIAELRYSKRTILNAYVNEIYLGQNGPVSISGVGAAARFYFGKDVRALTVSESAMLAGVIRSPYRYSPLYHPERARGRRDFVLGLLRAEGKISAEEFEAARAAPLRAAAHPFPARSAPYLVDAIRREIPVRAEDLEKRGFRIYTGVLAPLQTAAERAVRDQARRLEGRGGDRPELAFVAMSPHTGEVLALVGGVDYGASQFNRVHDAARQTGSAFKPIVYAAALEQAARSSPSRFTAATLLEDAPLVLNVGGRAWRPRNARGAFLGAVTLRVALEESLNIPAVRLGDAVGIRNVAQVARDLGVERSLPLVPSLAIGSGEMTPMELMAAYSAFAGGGVRTKPVLVRRVVNMRGKEVFRQRTRYAASLSPRAAYLLTHLLEGVLDRGTGASARAWGFQRPGGGKTGTTNEGRDGWFVGYTPDVLALAWSGYDDNRPGRLTGTRGALPVWAQAMSAGLRALPSREFPVPEGIVFADVDRSNGLLANAACPSVVREAFLAGTEPREVCARHELLPEVPETAEGEFAEPALSEEPLLAADVQDEYGVDLSPSEVVSRVQGSLIADEIEATAVEARVIYVKTLDVGHLDARERLPYEAPPPGLDEGMVARGTLRQRSVSMQRIVARRIYAAYVRADVIYAGKVVREEDGEP